MYCHRPNGPTGDFVLFRRLCSSIFTGVCLCECCVGCMFFIMYSVGSFVSVEDTFKQVLERMKAERANMPRMIIYGGTLVFVLTF